MKPYIIFAALLALTGCACERHPDACAVGAIFLAGSIAACAHHHTIQRHDVTIQPVNCQNGSCL